MIDVQLTDDAPAAFRLTLRGLGEDLDLERSDPYVVEAEDEAFDRVLETGQRLPSGAIEVVVSEDAPLREFPTSTEVGRAIARRLL